MRDKLDIIDYLIVNRDQLIPKLKDLDQQRANLLAQHPDLRQDIMEQFKYGREAVIMDFLMTSITNDNYLIQTIITNMDVDAYIASEERNVNNLVTNDESSLLLPGKP